MLQPYMPSTADAVLRMLNGPRSWLSLGSTFEADVQHLHRAVPSGHALGKPELLFAVIADEAVQDLQGRFAGTQAEAAASAASTATATATATVCALPAVLCAVLHSALPGPCVLWDMVGVRCE